MLRKIPVEHFVLAEVEPHLEADVHVAADEIQIVKRDAHFDRIEARHLHAHRRRIAAGDAGLVQHRFVHYHLQLEREVFRRVGYIDASELLECGDEHASAAAANAAFALARPTAR